MRPCGYKTTFRPLFISGLPDPLFGFRQPTSPHRMDSPQSLNSPDSPTRNCFCGCLASPCRDHKYCSERCAREDTEKMLMGEPSHYRNVSQVCKGLFYYFRNQLLPSAQTEVLDRLVQSESPCRLAKKIMVEANATCDDEYEHRGEFKPLPPLPSFPSPEGFMDIKNTLDVFKREDTPLPRLKRLHSSILARRTGQKIV